MIAFVPPTTGFVVLAGIVAAFVFEVLRIRRAKRTGSGPGTAAE